MTIRSCSGLTSYSSASSRTASPLRFMYVSGLTSSTSFSPTNLRAVRAWQCRFLTSACQRSARRSTVRNPRLWGVNWYSMPGLPSPTISFTRYPSPSPKFQSFRVSRFHVARECNFETCETLKPPTHATLRLGTTRSPAPARLLLLLFLLLGLLGLLCLLGWSSLGALFLNLLLALLNNFGLGGSSSSFGRGHFRSRRHFFLHGNDVRHRLIGVAEELEVAAVLQVGDTQHFAEHQLSNISFDGTGNVFRQALQFDLARHLLQNSALLLDAGGLALKHDGYAHLQLLVHGDALQVHVQQGALDGLMLPVHDHGASAFAVEGQIEDGVVPGSRLQNARDLLGIERHRDRVLLGAVHHSRHQAAAAHAPGYVLAAALPRLGFEYIAFFVCGCHMFESCLTRTICSPMSPREWTGSRARSARRWRAP